MGALMARKDLLKGLMGDGPKSEGSSLPPRPAKGAIGAVSKSIAELRGRALVEVPADMIDDAGLKDRLDEDADGIAALAESIREHGQQVPVLLRHSPNYEGRYEVVYGRRRVAALRLLRGKVTAMVRDLNDRELIVAQGQENTARRDLSFIEKANFARQMVAQGFERKIVCEALHIDKTVVSRMLNVADAVPEAVIRLIGAAPAAGRDRWMALAERIGDTSEQRIAELAQGDTSDARFQAVFDGLAPQKPKARPAPRPLTGSDGAVLGQVKPSAKGARLTVTDPQFGDWLAARMQEIHREFLKERGE